MAEAYKTNYYDPMGKAHTGYIINGKTYKDPEGKERIEKGSVVETAVGNYTLTNSGGVKSDYLQTQKDFTANEIDKLKADSKNRHESDYNAKKATIDARKRQVKSEFNKKAKEEYLKAMEREKNIGQILKAQGLTGGMSESRILQNKLNYENIVNSLRENLNDSIFDLDNELLKLRNETDYNIAEDNSEYDKLYLQYMDRYYDDFSDSFENEARINADNYRELYSMEKDEELFNKEMEFEREKFNHEIMNDQRNYNLNLFKANNSSSKDTEYDRKLKEADLRSKYGDFSLYAEIYDWDEKTLEAIQEAYAMQNR